MATDVTELLECPMCNFTVHPSDEYVLQLHFEQEHTTDSPFKVLEDDDLRPSSVAAPEDEDSEVTPSGDEEEREESTVACPEPDCGEVVLLTDFNEHLDYHNSETLSFDEITGTYHSQRSSVTMQSASDAHHPHASLLQGSSEAGSTSGYRRKHTKRRKTRKHDRRDRSNTNTSEKSTLARSIDSFNPFSNPGKRVKPPHKSARLGKSELGPYAWEERMPPWLHDQLAAGPKITMSNRIGRDGRMIKQEQIQNETAGLIPILAQLSALDSGVEKAYYSHPSSLHVGKTPREGGFCGYRNIQMLLSYIQGAKAQGHEDFPGRTPGVLVLQNLIEQAWDQGINHIGRIQTGGIRGTRKYIGTPEAQALFLSSQIDCAVEMFTDSNEHKLEAHEALLEAIERYFVRAATPDGSNVFKTTVPPIYLQQPGHSITIVGFERRHDGACNLVVFDPMYSTSPAMHKLLGRKNIRSARPEILHAYRRGARQLRKHAAFEILMLTATPPMFPAWDVLRQFPDCRFVYAFFRSKTLGYDVYPEDHFLQNFPWQQYGGLWICDEARFARSEWIDKSIAFALQSITSANVSPYANGSFGSPISSNQCSMMPTPISVQSPTRKTPSFEDWFVTSDGSMMKTGSNKPRLSLLTDIDKKYPGFPTSLSPTLSAKKWFPSPLSESDSGVRTPFPALSEANSTSPTSIRDGASRCRSRDDLRYDHMASIDNIIKQDLQGLESEIDHGGFSTESSPSDCPPCRVTSPRTALARSSFYIHCEYGAANNMLPQDPAGSYLMRRELVRSPVSSIEVEPRHNCMTTMSKPYIEIANGTEASTTSPLSPSGTVLAYTSRRPVYSGLLGVSPLSETQVAEYRFWRPCPHRSCAFGCGRAYDGELAAAKRLFRPVEEPSPEKESTPDGNRPAVRGMRNTGRYGYDKRRISPTCGGKRSEIGTSSWAGRRLVSNWDNFLVRCERDGVASY